MPYVLTTDTVPTGTAQWVEDTSGSRQYFAVVTVPVVASTNQVAYFVPPQAITLTSVRAAALAVPSGTGSVLLSVIRTPVTPTPLLASSLDLEALVANTASSATLIASPTVSAGSIVGVFVTGNGTTLPADVTGGPISVTIGYLID